MLILARARDTIANECGGEIRPVVPHELVLLQAGKANIHDFVIEGRAKYKRCPVSDGIGVRAPSTSFAFGNALLVDIVMGGRRLLVPLVIRPLVWISQLAGLAGLYCQRYRLGFGPFAR